MISKLFHLLLTFLFLTTFLNIVTSNTTCDIKCYLVVNPSSKVFLEAGEIYVYGKRGNGANTQKWCLKPKSRGSYSIINVGNGLALDAEFGGAKGTNIMTYKEHGGLNQEWFINFDGTITNIQRGLVLKMGPNNMAVLDTKNGSYSEFFELMEVPI